MGKKRLLEKIEMSLIVFLIESIFLCADAVGILNMVYLPNVLYFM